MRHKYHPRNLTDLLLLIVGIVFLVQCTGIVVAEIPDEQIIGDLHISPIYEKIIPIEDGKEIIWLEEGSALYVLKQKVTVGILSFFEGTVLRDIVMILTPIISALFGFFFMVGWNAKEKRDQSPLLENILTHVKANPGCTQKQLVEAMGCSRGSACYHLDKLLNTKRLHRVYTGNVPHYYLVSGGDAAINSLELEIQYLISQKKSGMVLRSMSENPASTRKELAKLLSLSPVTIRWYIDIFSDKKLIAQTKNGRKFQYSLTDEAKEIYEFLTANPGANP